MTSAARWSVMLRVAVILAMVSASGCATIARWKQEHRQASVRRQQSEQAQDRAKADRAAALNQARQVSTLRRLQRELVARGDPDSLAAGALFERALAGMTGSASLGLAARAVAAAPDRPYLAFVQLQLCESAPACDAAPLEARLRRLDPHNGITWTYQLLRAQQADNQAQWDEARAGLARSRRVAVYWNSIASHLARAVAGKAGFDATKAMIGIIGIEAGFSIALQPVATACSAQDVLQPERLLQCRQIAAAFCNADTNLFEAYGSSLALRLWPAGSAQSLAIIQERRVLRYRAALLARDAAKLNSPQAMKTLAGVLSRYPTEQTAFRAWFAELGLAQDPPANWQDETPGG